MQKFNYHSHTKRCGHAIGEDEEYVLEAIKNGYTRMGFSDHAPFKDGYSEQERMAKEELNAYIESVKALQSKYQDQIEIVIGLEFEFYKAQLAEIKEYKEQMDYLIIGQHENELFQKGIYEHYEDEDVLTYAQLIVEALEMGLADIVAHPDLFMYDKKEWTKACDEATHMICQAASKMKVPLEVNLNGIRYGKVQLGDEYRYRYPHRKFWEIAQNYDVEVIFGLDAHEPSKYSDHQCYEIVTNEIIKGLKLNFKPDFRIKKK